MIDSQNKGKADNHGSLHITNKVFRIRCSINKCIQTHLCAVFLLIQIYSVSWNKNLIFNIKLKLKN